MQDFTPHEKILKELCTKFLQRYFTLGWSAHYKHLL